jgi:NAD(P)-dependent dehydrogenase (short-subunit alcohol dehydrogenase family)
MKRGVLLALGLGLLAQRAWHRSRRRWDLQGRNILVTGGSRGLGLVIARQLALAGARVAICARNEETLERARAELSTYGGRVLAVKCDVSRRGEVEQMVARVADELGPIDALINNAGTITVGPVDTMDVEDFQAAMDVNFWGPLHVILAVLPDMRRRRAGRIVNVASIGGKISVPHLLPYSASKFALVGLSEGLRAELARAGIQVSTICPGLMRTGSPRHAFFKGRHRAEYAWFSISDSLPLTSISAESAAGEILLALRSGEAHRVLSFPAKVGALVHGAFPGLTADVLAVVSRALPTSGADGGRVAVKGEDSTSPLSPSRLTKLGDEAAIRNNQTGG